MSANILRRSWIRLQQQAEAQAEALATASQSSSGTSRASETNETLSTPRIANLSLAEATELDTGLAAHSLTHQHAYPAIVATTEVDLTYFRDLEAGAHMHNTSTRMCLRIHLVCSIYVNFAIVYMHRRCLHKSRLLFVVSNASEASCNSIYTSAGADILFNTPILCRMRDDSSCHRCYRTRRECKHEANTWKCCHPSRCSPADTTDAPIHYTS